MSSQSRVKVSAVQIYGIRQFKEGITDDILYGDGATKSKKNKTKVPKGIDLDKVASEESEEEKNETESEEGDKKKTKKQRTDREDDLDKDSKSEGKRGG